MKEFVENYILFPLAVIIIGGLAGAAISFVLFCIQFTIVTTFQL